MKVELLAPGGSFESVIAAYNAGADAVYTGGLMFGARAGANNLTTEELIEALEYAHVHDRKLYLTVNTLLKDKEIETELYDYLLPLYENGLDAVIVQDIGVFKFIRDNFPLMHIHASTQMTIFGKDTVAFLKDLGASRIVTPRELSLKEIEDIKNDIRLKDMEIESFVHGALCYCYSGQCFMSSYIGGRSGNRGRCAQPCRMEYDVLKDGKVLNPGNNKYVLSPKDICTLKILPEIIKSGVYSLKIEGRMKKTEYITGVVSIYRKYLDMYLNIPDKYNVDENDIKKLADLFNRNGFNESYYKQHNGRNMISLKKPEFRKENREFNQYLKEKYIGFTLKKNLNIKVTFIKEQPFTISTMVNGTEIIYEGNPVSKALNKPIDKETLLKQMKKTGNSDFDFTDIEIICGEDGFLPIGAINQARRDFLEKVRQYLISQYTRKSVENSNIQSDKNNANNKYIVDLCNKNTTKSVNINVLVSTKEQFKVSMNKDFVKRIYVESSDFSENKILEIIEEGHKADKEIYIAMPYVYRMADKNNFHRNYVKIIEKADGSLIRSFEEYLDLRKINMAKNCIFDYNVYTYNRIAKDFYLNFGGVQTTVPLELNHKEIEFRGLAGDEMIVYGYMPAMISAGCGLKTCNSCKSDNSTYEVVDKHRNRFITKCVCRYCYNVMYNCKPLSLFKFSKEIISMTPDSVRLSFTTESGNITEQILNKAQQAFIYEKNIQEDDQSTRGHFKRGVL